MFRKTVWRALERELDNRHLLLDRFSEKLRRGGFDKYKSELAATDIFVEKAQVYLTWRARFLTIAGVVAALLSIVSLVSPAVLLINDSIVVNEGDAKPVKSAEKDTMPVSKYLIKKLVQPAEYTETHPVSANTDKDAQKQGAHVRLDTVSTTRLYTNKNQYNYIFYLLLLRSSSIGGAFVAAAGFLIYLSRSCFHEATILYNRRHALRFGRLFVYLKMSGDMFDLKELETAFKWTDEYSTAFKELKPEAAASPNIIPGLSSVIDLLQKVADNLGKKTKKVKNDLTEEAKDD